MGLFSDDDFSERLTAIVEKAVLKGRIGIFADTARKLNRKLYKIKRFCECNLNDFTNEVLKVINE